jgi:DNA-binding NarL/FixJ family response regulator
MTRTGAVPEHFGATAMDTARTRVFLVEDSDDIRARITDMLAVLDHVSVIGTAVTPESAVAGILQVRPDCVVLDIQLVGGSGIEVLRRVHALEPGIVFIVLTNHADPQYRKVCIDSGANYFFDKSHEFEQVRAAVADVGARH